MCIYVLLSILTIIEQSPLLLSDHAADRAKRSKLCKSELSVTFSYSVRSAGPEQAVRLVRPWIL